jgi:2-C-methyl-D-erythritol 4-phosphate cytidylyltransferase
MLNKKFIPKDEQQFDVKNNYVSAVLVCAGNSTRMGIGKSKQFITLLEHPAIYYTLKAFQDSLSVKEIIIVCRDCDKNSFKEILSVYSFPKVTQVVTGGATRFESVKNGIMATDEKATHIAIHDGARCLITTEEIEKVVLSGILTGASTLGVAVKDTIKVVAENGIIKETPKRATLRAIQTPQVFSKKHYLNNLEIIKENPTDFTDDCQLFEHCGYSVTVVEGLNTNIKLTTQEDILLAEGILKGRNTQ